ncbi:MAG: segregation/condensation protein A [Faecalibacterium sp.]|jgi:segregation and condensation protein A|nr:segregation/condensation protein A [Faecalibacterium sp.]
MEELTFTLANFEGPLDLLLALIGKNKMDLHDIPIFDLIEQYMAVIRSVQDRQLDVASEFIEMAAHLVQMKSYLLLPRSDEAERMRQELTGQLIEYDMCKKMAGRLKAMSEDVYIAVRRPAEPEQKAGYPLHHDPQLLIDAWDALQGRGMRRKPPSAERFDTIVAAPFVSVSSRVVHVLRGLVTGKLRTLHQLFLKSDTRSTTVATFLAVLELVRHGRLQIEDDNSLSMNHKKLAGKQQTEEPQWT